jgi:hypothetical protein
MKLSDQLEVSLKLKEQENDQGKIQVFHRIGSIETKQDEEIIGGTRIENFKNYAAAQSVIHSIQRVKSTVERREQYSKMKGMNHLEILLERRKEFVDLRKQRRYKTIVQRRDASSGVNVIDMEANGNTEVKGDDDYVWDIYAVDKNSTQVLMEKQADFKDLTDDFDLVYYEYEDGFGYGEEDLDDEYDSEDSNAENRSAASYPEDESSDSEDRYRRYYDEPEGDSDYNYYDDDD